MSGARVRNRDLDVLGRKTGRVFLFPVNDGLRIRFAHASCLLQLPAHIVQQRVRIFKVKICKNMQFLCQMYHLFGNHVCIIQGAHGAVKNIFAHL